MKYFSFRFKLLAFGFALLLVLPALDQLFGFSNGYKSTENRKMEGIPALHFPHVRTFIREFDQYYKENFGWRNALFYLYSRWKYRVLETSPLPEKVIVGKEGWFYLGNSYNNVVDQHRGLLPLSTDSLGVIAANLNRIQRELSQKGIRLYVFIAPDSHTIYPEFMPEHLRVADNPSRLDRLRQYVARHTSVPLIDIRDTLMRAKPEHLLYYQTDTHWNDYGALIGSTVIVDQIRRDIPTLPPIRLADYQITKMRGVGGDLVSMLTLQHEIKDQVYYEIKPARHLATRQTEEVPNTETGFPSRRFMGANPSLPKLLFIGDSFSHSMAMFIPGYFRESYFVRSSRLDPKLVEAEQPNVVIIEVVERNLGFLARF